MSLPMNKVFLILLVLCSACSHADRVEFRTGKQTLLSSTDEAGFILLTEQGNTHIEVLDKNKDGVVDLMRLSIFNSQGQEVMQVEDGNLDGVIDQRWHKQEPSYYEVMYNGAWHTVLKAESGLYIETLNGNLSVTNDNGYLQVQTHNK